MCSAHLHSACSWRAGVRAGVGGGCRFCPGSGDMKAAAKGVAGAANAGAAGVWRCCCGVPGAGEFWCRPDPLAVGVAGVVVQDSLDSSSASSSSMASSSAGICACARRVRTSGKQSRALALQGHHSPFVLPCRRLGLRPAPGHCKRSQQCHSSFCTGRCRCSCCKR